MRLLHEAKLSVFPVLSNHPSQAYCTNRLAEKQQHSGDKKKETQDLAKIVNAKLQFFFSPDGH